ncbi:MAG TPA: HD domain-containing protein [archaeon]|jgi:HD superfamily phosphohydrolase|nr:HD domain-containing protein [archaeon]
MKFPDPAYGEVEISEPVLLEVIMAGPVQRLKGLNQYGTWQFIMPSMKANRFDHSLGVCFLLRRMNASLEEQMAGLLHDISHTAFSHVVDYLYRQEEKQEHHDGLFQQVFMSSQIPKIAQTNGIRPELFLEMGNFFLLERPIPDLCADRLDYFFRDSVLLGVCKQDEIGTFMEHLVVQEGEIMVDDPLIAKMMAVGFMECSKRFWSSPTQAASYQILADAIKSGLEAGVISEKDFLLTDQEVYRKLRSSKNLNITSKLDILNPEFFAVNSPDDFDFFVKTKARYIDPKVVRNGTVKRLSELDDAYKKVMQDFIGKVSGGYHVKVFPRLRGLDDGRKAEVRPKASADAFNRESAFSPRESPFGSLPKIGSG